MSEGFACYSLPFALAATIATLGEMIAASDVTLISCDFGTCCFPNSTVVLLLAFTFTAREYLRSEVRVAAEIFRSRYTRNFCDGEMGVENSCRLLYTGRTVSNLLWRVCCEEKWRRLVMVIIKCSSSARRDSSPLCCCGSSPAFTTSISRSCTSPNIESRPLEPCQSETIRTWSSHHIRGLV